MRRSVTVLFVVLVSALALAWAQSEFRVEIDTVRTGEIPTEEIDHVYVLDLPAGVPNLIVSVDAYGDDADLAVYFGPHDEELFFDISTDPYPRFELASPRPGRYRIVVKNLLWQPLRYEVSVSSKSERAPVATPGGRPPALTLAARVVAPGEAVQVSFGGAPGNQRDWVGMFAAEATDRQYLTYQYTQGARDGVLTFRAPDHVGRYDLRLFEDDGYTLLARSTAFEVLDSARAPAPSAPGPALDPTPAQDVVSGEWRLDANGHRGSLRFVPIAGGWVGTYTLGGRDESLEDVSFDGTTLRFTRPLGTATQRYEGTLTTAGATLRWSGTFYQGAARSPFPWSAER